MLKITRINLRKTLDGSGQEALSVQIISSDYFSAEASLPLAKDLVISSNELTLINDKLLGVLAKQELDGALWQLWLKFTKEEKNKKYLPKPLSLLMEMVLLKLLAAVNRREVFEQINESLALDQKLFLVPTPLISVFNGALYGDTNLDFKDYLLIPLTKARTSFEQKLVESAKVYQKLAEVLKSAGYDADIGSLGAYAPDLVSTVEALDLMMAGINLAGFSPARDFGLGLDIGSASLYNAEEHNYLFRLSHNYFNSGNLSSLYRDWLVKYPIFYLEDVLAPDDLVAWQDLTTELRNDVVLAGGSLFANDLKTLRRGVAAGLANAVVISLQDCESLKDVVEMVTLAKKHNYQVVLAASQRESNEDFLADLAVALSVDFVKFGALARGERVAKYARLLAISQSLEVFK